MMLRSNRARGPDHGRTHGPGVLDGNGNQISISDLDIGAAQAQITVELSRWHLTLKRHRGLSFSTGYRAAMPAGVHRHRERTSMPRSMA